MRKKNMTNLSNQQFLNSSVLNNATYLDYFHRLEKICLAMFEWVNLPSSMDARFLEKTLFEFRLCLSTL